MNYQISIKWIVIIAIGLRSLHLLVHFAPPGHDITLLAMMVRIYLETWNEGLLIPSTWEPILGEQSFWGFHSLLGPIVALAIFALPISMISALKIVNVIAFSLYDLSILYFFLTFFKLRVHQFKLNHFLGFLSVCYLSPFPSRFLGSGGGVYIFSASIAIFALSHLINIFQLKSPSIHDYIALNILLVLALLIHPMPAFHTLAFSPLIILAFLVYHNKTVFSQRNLLIYINIVVFFALISSPITITFSRPAGAYLDAIYDWIRTVKSHYSIDFLWTEKIPDSIHQFVLFLTFLGKQFFPHLIFTAVLLFLKKKSPNTNRPFFMIFFVSTLLIWFGSSLPYIGMAFYPDRLIQYCYILFAIIITMLLGQIQYQSTLRTILLAVFFIASAGRFTWSYLIQANSRILLSPSDMTVIQKIPNFVKKNEIINTHYMDAGAWIPALIGRAVLEPHFHISFQEAWMNYRKRAISQQKKLFFFAGNYCNQDKKCTNKCKSQSKNQIRHENSWFCEGERLDSVETITTTL